MKNCRSFFGKMFLCPACDRSTMAVL